MTAPNMAISIVAARPQDFIRRIDELIDIHLQAMNYAPSAHLSRRTLWISNANQTNFTCSIALLHQRGTQPELMDPRQRSVGVAFSFQGAPDSWWHQNVTRGLVNSGLDRGHIAYLLSDYAELSEIHVHPHAQHKGLGRKLLNDVLDRSPHRVTMLSTPEVPDEANAAWQLYRSTGFTDLLRYFHFPVDPRPFGILRREQSR